MYLEQQIEAIVASLRSIEGKVDHLTSEIEVVRSEVNLLRGDPTGTERDLRQEFTKFKEHWGSDSPDVESLKNTLLKLRNSLGGITEAFSQPGEPEAGK